MWSLGLMVAVAVALLFVDGPAWFWPLGLALCLFVGPAQAASRSFLARVAPRAARARCSASTSPPDVRSADVLGRIRHLHLGVRHDRAGIAGIALVLGIGMIVFAFVPRGARPPQGRGRADPRELAAHAGIPPGSPGPAGTPAGTRARPGLVLKRDELFLEESRRCR